MPNQRDAFTALANSPRRVGAGARGRGWGAGLRACTRSLPVHYRATNAAHPLGTFRVVSTTGPIVPAGNGGRSRFRYPECHRAKTGANLGRGLKKQHRDYRSFI